MNAPRLLRTGATIVIAQATIAIVGVVALRVYTGLVTPAVFGASNLLLSAVGLGIQLFVAGFVATQLRFYSEAQARGTADEFAHQTLLWSLRATTALVLLTIVVLAVLRLMGVFSYAIRTLICAILWLYAMTVRNVVMSRIQAQRRQGTYATLQVIEAFLLLAVTFLALRMIPSVEFFLIGQIVALIGFVAIIVLSDPQARTIFFRHSGGDVGFGSKAWSYGVPFAPLSFFSWLANLGDRYTLGVMLGADAAGRYVAPFSIASRGMILGNSALCDLFRPLLFDAENQRDAAGARVIVMRWLMSSVALSAAGLTVVYFAGTLIVRWLLAPDYRAGAVAIMLWVSVGYAVCGVTQIIENRLLSLGHSARLLLPMILGAIANLAFSLVLIHRNGMSGAAQATCASFLVQNLTTYGFLLHAMRERHSHRKRGASVEPA